MLWKITTGQKIKEHVEVQKRETMDMASRKGFVKRGPGTPTRRLVDVTQAKSTLVRKEGLGGRRPEDETGREKNIYEAEKVLVIGRESE